MLQASSPSLSSTASPRVRIVKLWLLGMAALVFAMVVVGGATRLTESGLSIVEWQPVTGTVPPLDAGQWQAEFEKYQAIPQYRELNRGMSLDEFKVIYWWEWTHRLLGRLVGVLFLLPFVFFLWRRWIPPDLRTRLWIIFALGAAQGVAGWWMVASGLADRVEVSQYRLAFHLTLACAIFAAMLWTVQRLAPRPPVEAPARIRYGAALLVVLVLAQIYFGALVAGLRAGNVFNTWPMIDGGWMPGWPRLFFMSPLWRNLFENALTVQFDHRMAGDALWAVVLLHAFDVARTRAGNAALGGALGLTAAVTLQVVLGILTLVYQVPLPLGLLHQAMAVIVLAIAVVHAERLIPPTPSSASRPAFSPSA
jgi:cytochrome c oxidase assembly protein subunit 15